jgi:hypothetical protein
MKTLSEITAQFEGIREQGGNNEDFNCTVFKQLMQAVGWKAPQAWCMYAAQVCTELYLAQFDSVLINILRKVFNPSVTKTFSNFKKKYPELVLTAPEANCIVFWQLYIEGKAQWQGHAGIIKSVKGNNVETYEGNTNDKGSREGDGFYLKNRVLNYSTQTGLRCIGFVRVSGLIDKAKS